MSSKLHLKNLPLHDLKLIERTPVADHRGFLQRLYCHQVYLNTLHLSGKSTTRLPKRLAHKWHALPTSAICREQGVRVHHTNLLDPTSHQSIIIQIRPTHHLGPINIGSGIPITIREIANRIVQAIGKEELVNFEAIPEPAYSPGMILANIDRLKNEVGWVPDLTLDEGLSNAIAWWNHVESTIQMRR